MLHALPSQVGNPLLKLLDGSGGELAELEVTNIVIKHVGDVDAVGGNGITSNRIVEQTLNATTQHANGNLGALGTFQFTHYVFVGQFFACHQRVINIDDTVTRHDAHLLRGTSLDNIDDGNGVFLKAKLHADAIEATQQRAVHFIELVQGDVGAMRVKFFHHGSDCLVLEFVGIRHVDIVVVDIPHHLVELATAFNVDLFADYTFINI